MSELDTEGLIKTACKRELTDDESNELAVWAHSSYDKNKVYSADHPLIVFIKIFMKATRSTPFFASNFKRLNKTAMPIACQLLKQQEEQASKNVAAHREKAEDIIRDGGYYDPLPNKLT